jgi:hypothetical protein
LLAGCEAVLGLGSETTGPGPGGMDGGGADDGGAGHDVHATADAGADAWETVAFNAAGDASCPKSFTERKLVEITKTGSCACDLCVANPAPDCESGSLLTTWNGPDASATTCSAANVTYSGNGGKCVEGVVGLVPRIAITASAPVGGGCTAVPMAESPPSVAKEVLCTPPAGCDEDCQASAGKAFVTCLYQSGKHTCPPKMTNSHTVGTTASTMCGACSCSVKATGCTGSLAIYAPDAGCTGPVLDTLTADGTCQPMTGVSPGDSYVYTATATGVTCDAGASTATDELADSGTLCCP